MKSNLPLHTWLPYSIRFLCLAPKAGPQAKVLSGAIHTARLSQSPLRTVHRCIVRSLVLSPAGGLCMTRQGRVHPRFLGSRCLNQDWSGFSFEVTTKPYTVPGLTSPSSPPPIQGTSPCIRWQPLPWLSRTAGNTAYGR